MKQRRGGLFFKILIGIFIAGVLLAGGVAFVAYRAVQKVKQELPRQMNARMAELEKNKNVTPEDLAILRDLVKTAERKEASFLGMNVVSGITSQFRRSDEVTTVGRKALIAARDFLVLKNGNVGVRDMGEFFKKNPDLKAEFDKMQAEAKRR